MAKLAQPGHEYEQVGNEDVEEVGLKRESWKVRAHSCMPAVMFMIVCAGRS
jgi:hypothetical protein